MTVDHAIVLADDGLTNELAYTALSRGRGANHLYVACQHEDARAEYAPSARSDADPLDRLIATLKTSRAGVFAIGGGRPDDRRSLGQAERELASGQNASPWMSADGDPAAARYSLPLAGRRWPQVSWSNS